MLAWSRLLAPYDALVARVAACILTWRSIVRSLGCSRASPNASDALCSQCGESSSSSAELACFVFGFGDGSVARTYIRYEHRYHRCGPECAGCPLCDGGLAQCRVCGCAEGELLTSCPGVMLAVDAREAILMGSVVDLDRMRFLRAANPALFRRIVRKEPGI